MSKFGRLKALFNLVPQRLVIYRYVNAADWPIKQHVLGLDQIGHFSALRSLFTLILFGLLDRKVLQKSHNKQLDLTHGQLLSNTLATTDAER